MDKKLNIMLLLLALLAVISASACIGEEKSGAAKSTGSEKAGPEQALQELVVGISTDVNNWNIELFPDGDGRFVWSQVYETLVRLDPDLQLKPGLATSWETPDKGKTWVFHLREGVAFHDGTPFNADAVVFSYKENSYSRQAMLRAIDHVEALNASTVKFVLKKPMSLPFYLTHIAWPVMSPTCVDKEGKFIKPIGTGSFKFEKQVKGQEIELVRNEEYWGNKSELTKVTFKVIPEVSTRVMALETGEVDMILKVPEYDVIRLEKEQGINVYKKHTTFTDFLQFNCKKSPFDDKKVRQSIAYAVDTDQIVKTVLNGIGTPAKGRPYSPIMLYSNPGLKVYSPDPEKARALLAEAGWKDTDGDGVLDKNGKPLQVKLLVGKGEWADRHNQISQVLQAELKKVGIVLEIQTLEGGAISSLENSGDFDIILRSGYYVWGPYPKHFFIHTSMCPNSHYSNESYDKLEDEADSTIDPEKQKELYYALQDFVIEEVPAFYLVHEEKVIAASSSVRGYTISAEDPWMNLEGVYLDNKSE